MGNDDSTTVDLTQHDDDKEPAYGEAGSPENPTYHLKFEFDGIDNIREFWMKLSEFTQHVELALAGGGWELAEPIDGGNVFTVWKGEGAPPEELRLRPQQSAG